MEVLKSIVRPAGFEDLRRLPMERGRWRAELNALWAIAVASVAGADWAATAWAGAEPGQTALSAATAALALALWRHRGLAGLRSRVLHAGPDAERASLELLERRARSHPPVHALAAARLAEWELAHGDLDRAFRLLGGLSARGWGDVSLGPVGRATIPTRLAVREALRGSHEAAERWISVVEARGGPCAALVPRIVSMLRRGEVARAVAYVEARFDEAERRLTAAELKPARVLWAFALTNLDRPTYREGRSPRVHDILAGARPLAPAQLRWLTAQWPELRAFVERHGLTD
jgi:hypothetical protein